MMSFRNTGSAVLMALALLGLLLGLSVATPAGSIASAAQTPPHLKKTHGGWRQTACFECHATADVAKIHDRADLKPPDCGACHGFNGAPHEGHAVKINPCGTCHAWVDHFAAFEAPSDCISCHNHPESPRGR